MCDSKFAPFIINFYTTYLNGLPVTTVITSPPTPGNCDIIKHIKELICYIESIYICNENYYSIVERINFIKREISLKIHYFEKVKDLICELDKVFSSKHLILEILKSILSILDVDSDVRGELILPSKDHCRCPSKAIVQNLNKKRTTTTTVVQEFEPVSNKLLALQTEITTIATNSATFVSKVKNAFNSIAGGYNNCNYNSSELSEPIQVYRRTRRPVSPQASTNIINNIARSLVGPRYYNNYNRGSPPRGRYNKKHCNNAVSELYLYEPAIINPIQLTPSTEIKTTDYYEISSSYSDGTINVLYAYYPACSKTSSFACTFSLTPDSFISLSLNAYDNVIRLPLDIKNEICQYSGYNCMSSNPNNSDLWYSYLIWVYSYMSTIISKQLGFNLIKTDLPINKAGSANFTLGADYLQKVGNYGLTLEIATMDSDVAAMVGVSIPHEWPNLMYSSKDIGYEYMGNVTVNMVKRSIGFPIEVNLKCCMES